MGLCNCDLNMCLALCLLFCRLCATSVTIHSFFFIFLYWRYVFQPNRPSSVVQVVVIKEPAAHCKAVLFLLYGYLGLHLVMWVNLNLIGWIKVTLTLNCSKISNRLHVETQLYAVAKSTNTKCTSHPITFFFPINCDGQNIFFIHDLPVMKTDSSFISEFLYCSSKKCVNFLSYLCGVFGK
jgi:hypothetical protein